MDVGDWLKSLGLEQYEAAFRENGVDAEVPRALKEHLADGMGPGRRHDGHASVDVVAARLAGRQLERPVGPERPFLEEA